MIHLRSIFIALGLAFAAIPATATDGALALAVLKSDASIEAKARACQNLAVYGHARAIPALADLLGDEALAAYARTALEAMDDPQAAEVLRSALATLEGESLIGVVTSLGVKRDNEAVDALAALAKADSGAVSSAALVALAQIASKDSAKAILSVLKSQSRGQRLKAADAALMAADTAAREGNRALARRLAKAVKTADVPSYIQKAATELLGS